MLPVPLCADYWERSALSVIVLRVGLCLRACMHLTFATRVSLFPDTLSSCSFFSLPDCLFHLAIIVSDFEGLVILILGGNESYQGNPRLFLTILLGIFVIPGCSSPQLWNPFPTVLALAQSWDQF